MNRNNGGINFKGMAFDAKLAFFDIGKSGSLSIPSNIDSDMFEVSIELFKSFFP
jgi:hypothetical protein